MIDISVGGWSIPYAEKGYLSVWAISRVGKVRFEFPHHTYKTSEA